MLLVRTLKGRKRNNNGNIRKKTLLTVLIIMLAVLISSNSALAQNNDSLTVSYEPVNTENFNLFIMFCQIVDSVVLIRLIIFYSENSLRPTK